MSRKSIETRAVPRSRGHRRILSCVPSILGLVHPDLSSSQPTLCIYSDSRLRVGVARGLRLQSFRGLRSVQQPLIFLDVGVFRLGEKYLVSRGMHSFPCPPGQHPPRQAQAVVLRPLAAFVAATRTLYTSSPLLSATYPPAKAPSSRSTEMNIVRSTNGRTNKRVCPKPHLE